MKNRIFLSFLASCLLIVMYDSACAQSRDEGIIAYAKRIKVSSLDSTLPRRSIQSWIGSIVGPKAVISWEVNDCGEQTGIAGDGSGVNPPICAEVDAKLTDGRTVGISIEVGTHRAGVKGRPNVAYVYVRDNEQSVYPVKLRDLRLMIQEVKCD